MLRPTEPGYNNMAATANLMGVNGKGNSYALMIWAQRGVSLSMYVVSDQYKKYQVRCI